MAPLLCAPHFWVRKEKACARGDCVLWGGVWPSNSPHVTPAARAEANRFTGLLVPQPIEGRSRLTSSSHLGTDTVAGAHPVPTHSPSLLRAKREDAGHPTRTLPSLSSLESGGRGRGRVMNVNVSKRKGIFTPKRWDLIAAVSRKSLNHFLCAL